MRGQSEAIGALILAFMILFMLVGANIILRQQAQIIRYNMKLADIIARRQMENLAFDYRDGVIYAIPSTEMDVLAVVAYNDTSVVYVNTSRIHLSVNQWTPLITNPQLAQDVFSLKYVLGVVTGTGNLLTWMPPLVREITEVGIVGSVQRIGEFKAYYAGNSSNLYVSYSGSVTGVYGYGYAGVRADASFTVSTIRAPIIVLYTGSPNITEYWSTSTVNVTVRGSLGGLVTASFTSDGVLRAFSVANATVRQMALGVGDYTYNRIGSGAVNVYVLPGGELVAVLSVRALTVNNVLTLEVATANTAVRASYVSTAASYEDPYAWQCTGDSQIALEFKPFILEQYAYVYFNCGLKKFTGYELRINTYRYVSVFISDPVAQGTTVITIPVSTPVISNMTGGGLLLNLDPPVTLRQADGYTAVINTTAWNIKRSGELRTVRYNIENITAFTRVDKVVALPTGMQVNATGFMKIELYHPYSTAYEPPSSGPAPPPVQPNPPQAPPALKLLYYQSPIPLDTNPTDTRIQVIVYHPYTDVARDCASRMLVNYTIADQDTNTRSQGVAYFAFTQTPLGYYPAVEFSLSSSTRRTITINVYLDGQLFSHAVFYNYRDCLLNTLVYSGGVYG